MTIFTIVATDRFDERSAAPDRPYGSVRSPSSDWRLDDAWTTWTHARRIVLATGWHRPGVIVVLDEEGRALWWHRLRLTPRVVYGGDRATNVRGLDFYPGTLCVQIS